MANGRVSPEYKIQATTYIKGPWKTIKKMFYPFAQYSNNIVNLASHKSALVISISFQFSKRPTVHTLTVCLYHTGLDYPKTLQIIKKR